MISRKATAGKEAAMRNGVGAIKFSAGIRPSDIRSGAGSGLLDKGIRNIKRATGRNSKKQQQIDEIMKDL